MAGNETLENVNPTVHERLVERKTTAEDEDDDIEDLFDTREIFDILSISKLMNCDNTKLLTSNVTLDLGYSRPIGIT